MHVEIINKNYGGQKVTEYHWLEAVITSDMKAEYGPIELGKETPIKYRIQKRWSFSDPRKNIR